VKHYITKTGLVCRNYVIVLISGILLHCLAAVVYRCTHMMTIISVIVR